MRTKGLISGILIMKLVLILFVVIASPITMAGVNTCKFGYDVVFDRYVKFGMYRQVKKFDRENDQLLLQNFQYRQRTAEEYMSSITANGEYILEHYNLNRSNEIVTIHGMYDDMLGGTLRYIRDINGVFHFHDWTANRMFGSTISNLNSELPDDFDKDYKDVVTNLINLRRIMFEFRNYIIKDYEYISLFEYNPFSGGFHAQFVDNMDGYRLDITLLYEYHQQNANITHPQIILGALKCGKEMQKFKIVDQKLIVDREPSRSIN